MEEYNEKQDIKRLTSFLHRKEPVLRNPEALTDDIMQRIGMDASKSRRIFEPHSLIIFKRLLAAASVCLFLVFAYEQYIVVDKIGRLEKQNAGIAQNPDYDAAMKINQVIALIKSDPKMLNHYKNINKEKANKLSLLKAAIFIEAYMLAGNDSINQYIQR